MDPTGLESESDDEDFEDLLFLHILYQFDTYISKQPIKDNCETGLEFVHKVLTGHRDRCYDLFRMEKHVFQSLCHTLRIKNLLHDSKFVPVEEQVAIFLMIIGHNESNRKISNRFQHSGETISRHFKTVLKAIVNLGKELIFPPSFLDTPKEIRNNLKYDPWFKDCIGAIDGTHVTASVPSKNQILYRGKKTNVTQKVMCACSFDMRFTFVYAGWEGTASDSQVFVKAITSPELKFPHPPTGKYYIVDSSYINMPGYLMPYCGERYRLQDYMGAGRQPTGKKELFNFYHSSLRNVIERCFGVLKTRFPILKQMPPYHLRTQGRIVIAACTLHNFIKSEMRRDKDFMIYDNEELIINNNDEPGNADTLVAIEIETTQGRQEIAHVRNEITNALAGHYCVTGD